MGDTDSETNPQILEEELDEKIRAAVVASRRSFEAELDSCIKQSLEKVMAGASQSSHPNPSALPTSGGKSMHTACSYSP